MSSVETCVATDSGSVTCTIPSSAIQTDLTQILTGAKVVNSSLSTSSPMIIIAYGGAGGHGKADDGILGGSGGQGGQAQMTTSLDSFRETYNGSMLYFYFGAQGSTEHPGGKGGASTIVSVRNLNTEGASTANVILCAGGGGGGALSTGDAGAHGGNGGAATSALGQAESGAGQNGGSVTDDPFDTSAGGGTGGSNGIGGAGGAANSKDNFGGKSGTDGMGGMGGPVHLGDGPSTPTLWTNYSNIPGMPLDEIPAGLLQGQGGEGEYRDDTDANLDGSEIGAGGGGGGGYGGGGGGGGGTEENSGGGGGGGGTYAAASTITRVAPPYNVPSNNSGDGYVMIIFL